MLVTPSCIQVREHFTRKAGEIILPGIFLKILPALNLTKNSVKQKLI